jgi:RecA/RadA recombinase
VKLLEIQGIEFDDVPLRLTDPPQGDVLRSDLPVDLSAVDTASGTVRLTTSDVSAEAEVTSTSGRNALSRLPRPDRRLATFSALSNHEGVLRVWKFATGRMLLTDHIDIHIDRPVLQSIAERIGRAVDDEDALNWLAENFLLPSNHTECSAVVGHASAIGSLSAEHSTIVLTGRDAVLDIARTGRSLVATRLAPRRPSSAPSLATTVITARISFSTSLAESESAVLIAQGQTEYLDRWSRYNETEFALEEERAEELGEAGFSAASPEGPRWRLTLHRGSDTFLHRLVIGTDVLLVGEPPDGVTTNEHSVVGSVEGIADGTLAVRLLDGGHVPPKRGMLRYALSGSGTVYRRRLTATKALASGAVPLPELAALLEMREIPPRRVERRLHWDSPAVRQIFSEGPPTEAQKRAIQLALNTPDIVVIQGPPGTGKTKVIAAIAARIAEEVGEVAAAQQVLLTSHQHDAVENVAARTVVFGLPSVKHGRHEHGGSWFTQWRQDRLRSAQEMLGKQSQGELAEALQWLHERYTAYLLAPLALVDAAQLLADVCERCDPFLPVDVSEAIRSEISSIYRQHRPPEKRTNLAAAIRGIRSTPSAHLDDGPGNASRLLRRLDREDTSDLELSPLHQAASVEELDPDLGLQLHGLRNSLLDRFAPVSLNVLTPQSHAGVVRRLEAAIDALEARLEVDGQGMALVLQRFVHDLERDPLAVEAALAAYAPVVASTCQAAATLAQQTGRQSSDRAFDTVIVDEAARANPLDLQIPMTLARRRVVLVGDQRQLPHLVDEEIAASTSASEAESEELKQSLFARLFDFLQEMRTSGQPDRTVTLDAQYRMHPTLGRFVSEQFYEPHGARLESPLPPDHFSHDLSGYEGRCASWHDVPAAVGREESGRSKSRRVEARWIASEVRRLMEEAPSMSFGVITFYRAQVDSLMEELVDVGLAEIAMESDRLELRPEWKYTVDEEGETIERLRVGTVDSFQGMEFDVVLLSTVRTPDLRSSNARTQFGHLVVPNRLCVSMSRQRRLLVVVGDRSSLTTHPLSDEHVGALVAFSELSDREVNP